MISGKVYYFRKEKKKEFLDGRTITYLAEKLSRNRDGLNMVLNGHVAISYQYKKQLLRYKNECGDNKPESYYFYESETGGKK